MAKGRSRQAKHRQPDPTGRNANGARPTDRFVRLGMAMLCTNAYRALSPNARSLMVELAMLDNGSNNGSLYLGVRDAADRLGVADVSAAQRAFDDLVTLGFVTMTRDAHFRVKAAETSRARCWQLNWIGGPVIERRDAFEACEPAPRTLERRRMERGLRALKRYRQARDSHRLPVQDFATIPPFGDGLPAGAVPESVTPNAPIGGNARPAIVRLFATHTAVPWGQGGNIPMERAPNWAAQLSHDRRGMFRDWHWTGWPKPSRVTYGAVRVASRNRRRHGDLGQIAN